MFSYTTTIPPPHPPVHTHTHTLSRLHLLFSSLPPEWLPSALPGAVPPVAARAWCIPVYRYLGEVIIEMSSMRDEDLACLSVCVCGREVSWPCSVSGCPNLDMAHQGLPTRSRRKFIFVLPLVVSASFWRSSQYRSFFFCPSLFQFLFHPVLHPALHLFGLSFFWFEPLTELHFQQSAEVLKEAHYANF